MSLIDTFKEFMNRRALRQLAGKPGLTEEDRRKAGAILQERPHNMFTVMNSRHEDLCIAAARAGNADMVDVILAVNPDAALHTEHTNNISMAHIAVEKGDLRMLRALLAARPAAARIHTFREGITPTDMAATHANPAIAEAISSANSTPLHALNAQEKAMDANVTKQGISGIFNKIAADPDTAARNVHGHTMKNIAKGQKPQ